MKNTILASILLLSGIEAVDAKPRNISFITNRTSYETLDLGQSGPTMGDINVGHGELLDRKTNKVIGSFSSRAIVMVVDMPGGTREHDTITNYYLPGGLVTSVGMATYTQGVNLPTEVVERAIVGGTGKYAGARGVLTMTPIPGVPDKLIISLRFM